MEALTQMDKCVEAPVQGKTENTAGEIKLLNYSHLDEVLEA